MHIGLADKQKMLVSGGSHWDGSTGVWEAEGWDREASEYQIKTDARSNRSRQDDRQKRGGG